jgi:hypothetical protein
MDCPRSASLGLPMSFPSQLVRPPPLDLLSSSVGLRRWLGVFLAELGLLEGTLRLPLGSLAYMVQQRKGSKREVTERGAGLRPRCLWSFGQWGWADITVGER